MKQNGGQERSRPSAASSRQPPPGAYPRDRTTRRESNGAGSAYRPTVRQTPTKAVQPRPKPQPKPVQHPKRPERQTLPLYRQDVEYHRHNVNIGLSVTLFFMVLVGLVVLYSASFYQVQDQYIKPDVETSLVSPLGIDTVVKQLLCIVLGLAGMVFLSHFNYHKLAGKRLLPMLMGGTVFILLLVIIPGVGAYLNGARRWFRVGPISIQPSEIAKFAVVIYLAAAMTARQNEMRKLSGIFPLLVFPLIVFGLIMLQPNLSSGGTILIVTLIMLIVGGMDVKYFLLMLIAGVAAGFLLSVIEPYRLARLTSFMDPWAPENYDNGGYQLRNSLIALGSGGLFGAGIGQGRQKYAFLPYPDSDFIFAVIGEDWGFFGCSAVIIMFLVFIYFGLKIAMNTPDRFGAMLASGIVSVVGVQTALHIAVVAGFFPTTGQPLPFFSAGGSGIIIFLMAMGVLFNVSRYTVDVK